MFSVMIHLYFTDYNSIKIIIWILEQLLIHKKSINYKIALILMVKKKLLICTSSSITINTFFITILKPCNNYQLIILTNTSQFPLNKEINKLIKL